MIRVVDLQKRYGEIVAVNGVSFEIKAGEAFGLLGPNGAGKTTTISMMVGALAPDAGEVSVDGVQLSTDPETRRAIGIAPQDLAIYPEMSGAENLEFFGQLYGFSGSRLRERVDWGLEFAGLSDRRKDRAAKYSGGMKRRLNLACALVHEPKVVFCDEPTVGVDPQSRAHIFERIESLKSAGVTLIYTTHYMEEAQRLCDRVAIMDQGKVLALDSVTRLIDAHGGASIVEAELAVVPAAGITLPGTLDGMLVRVESDRPFDSIAELGRCGVDVAQLRVERPDLERVFLSLTGRSLRD